MKRLLSAIQYATMAHDGQVRKWTGEAYILHPLAVAETSLIYFPDNEVLAIAAVLHDVVEDTDQTIDHILRRFGMQVATIVDGLTNKSKPEDGNRAFRKQKYSEQIWASSMQVQTLKCLDIMDNLSGITEYGDRFAPVWIAEKLTQVDGMLLADESIHAWALEALKIASPHKVKAS
jgi:(p)ppGpp synthase/HD superfamily hydrolase